MVAAPCPSAYPPSPLRPSSSPAPIPIGPPVSGNGRPNALASGSSPEGAIAIPRGSYSRSICLSTSSGVSSYGSLHGAAAGTRDAASKASRRRSSGGLLGSAASTFTGGGTARLKGQSSSFAGSYEASLLSFRFASPPSAPCPFLLKLTAAPTCMLSSTGKPLAPPLNLPFEAHFFPLAEPSTPLTTCAAAGAPPPLESTPTTPYVSSIDLAAHFASVPFPSPLPIFPGYPIPAAGQIQAVISNPHGHGVRLFVIPYDVRGMPARHRMVLRQNIFEETQDDQGGSQRRLRASVTLHICCIDGKRPRTSTFSSTAKVSQSMPHAGLDPAITVSPSPRFFLHSTIRLVFSPQPSAAMPGDGPALRTMTRTVLDMGAPVEGNARFIPWVDDDAAEYAVIRQMRKVQIKRLGQQATKVLPAADHAPAYVSPASLLGAGLRSPVEPSSSVPLPRQVDTYALPPLARDVNHDLLPSPSIHTAPLPRSPIAGSPTPLAFAKVRSHAASSGRSSPTPLASEESELSRQMRGLRIDQPGR